MRYATFNTINPKAIAMALVEEIAMDNGCDPKCVPEKVLGKVEDALVKYDENLSTGERLETYNRNKDTFWTQKTIEQLASGNNGEEGDATELIELCDAGLELDSALNEVFDSLG